MKRMEVKPFSLRYGSEKLGISNCRKTCRLAFVTICRPILEARLHFDKCCGNKKPYQKPLRHSVIYR